MIAIPYLNKFNKFYTLCRKHEKQVIKKLPLREFVDFNPGDRRPGKTRFPVAWALREAQDRGRRFRAG